MPSPQQLINREFQNNKFCNWRLGRKFTGPRWERPLAGSLYVAGAGDDVGYLHTRAALMRNHLLHSQGRYFLFVRDKGDAGTVSLFQLVLHTTQTAQGEATQDRLVCVASLPPPPNPPSSLADTRLDSSIALFNAPAPSSGPDGDYDAVVSYGMGDARILRVRNHAAVSVSEPQFPLRVPVPHVGTRPFSLEAAYINPAGQLRVIAWSTRPKAGARAAACEIYALTLSEPDATSQQPPAPAVQAVQLLARSTLPPHTVVPSPQLDKVALGLDPSGWDSAGMGGVLGTDAQDPHHQHGQQQQQGEEEVEHIECRRNPQEGGGNDDDGADDVDPRTLAQAAERLAKYTSADPQGPLPEQQWTDLYNEGGSLDVGEGAEGTAACDVVVARVRDAGSQQQQGQQQQGQQQAQQEAEEWRCSFGPHKVLTNDTPGMLAVADDIDACVLEVRWPEGAPTPSITHAFTVPALAYIAAGKSQRKHLLAGTQGTAGAGISAVLVEASKFYYVYGWVSTRDEYGIQQVVDMEMQSGERVLGARLIPGFHVEGAPKPHALLVLVTSSRVVMHALCGTD